MSLYFNEWEPYPAQWTRNLYPGAVVDERSITDLRGEELQGYERVHLFAGLGLWQRALELAGFPAGVTVWTGSCPCQPFSSAGKRKGEADERHLWPAMYRLIAECRPDFVFGEQVSSAIGQGWLDRVFGDLEAAGFACGAAVLGAHSIGAPHIRQRLYWGAIRADWLGDSSRATSARLGQHGVQLADDQEPGRPAYATPWATGCHLPPWVCAKPISTSQRLQSAIVFLLIR